MERLDIGRLTAPTPASTPVPSSLQSSVPPLPSDCSLPSVPYAAGHTPSLRMAVASVEAAVACTARWKGSNAAAEAEEAVEVVKAEDE